MRHPNLFIDIACRRVKQLLAPGAGYEPLIYYGTRMLQDRIERGSEAIGFPPEGTPFKPHVTLGRVREGQRIPSRGLDDHASRFQPMPFVAEQLVLYESVLTTGGPRYESRLTLDLAS